jgi:hypothetical protein
MVGAVKFDAGGREIRAELSDGGVWSCDLLRPESKAFLESHLNRSYNPADHELGPAGGAWGAGTLAAAAAAFRGTVERPPPRAGSDAGPEVVY